MHSPTRCGNYFVCCCCGTIFFLLVQNRVSYELKNNFEGKHKLVKISEKILDAKKILRNRLVSSKL